MPATGRHQLPYWRLSGFYFFYFALLGSWLPYWGLYLLELGYGAVEIGYLSAVVMATKIVAPNIWGLLADRTGRRTAVIRAGSLLALLAFLGIFWRQDFWALVAIVSIYSFFWNAVLAQFEVVTLSHLGDQYARYSRIRVWGSIGFIVAVAGVGWLMDRIDLRTLPMILAALLALIWLCSLLVAERVNEAGDSRARQGRGQILRQPQVLAFFLVCFLLQVAHGPYYTFFSIHLESLAYSKTATGLLWSLGVFAEVLLFLVMHRVLAGYSIRAIMLVSLLLAVIRWLLIGYLAHSWWWLIIAQCLHAATFGSFHAIAVEIVRRVFVGHQGQGMALYSGLSFGAGGAVGAIASGWVWEIGPQLSFVMASVASALALVIAWRWLRGALLE